MRALGLLFLLALAALASPAHAQGEMQVVPGFWSTTNCPGSNTPCWQPFSATNPLPTTPGAAGAGASGTPTEATVTCGATSTVLLVAGAATTFVFVKVPSGGITTWFNVAGAPAVAAPPSIDLTGGMWQTWSGATGFLPTSGFNCIAATPQPITLVYK